MILSRRLLTTLLSGAAIAAGAAGAQPARAAYSVMALAESGNGLYGEYARGYNVPSYDDMSIGGGPGFTTFGGGGCDSRFSACSVTGYGATATISTLTAATEATSIDVTTVPSYYYPDGLTASASAYATANLATGSVGVASTGTYGLSGCCSGQDGGHGASAAENTDVLHFTVAGASAGTMTTIAVTFTVDGSITTFSPEGDSFGSLSAVLDLGGGSFQGNVQTGGGTGYDPVLSEGPPPTGWLTESLSPASPGDFTFHGTLALTGGAEDLGVVEYLYANCGIGTACDYSHTATLSFDLPSDVTFTSDSGVLLTPPTGVPEPATWALVMVGVGGVGGLTRRRRAALAVGQTASPSSSV